MQLNGKWTMEPCWASRTVMMSLFPRILHCNTFGLWVELGAIGFGKEKLLIQESQKLLLGYVQSPVVGCHRSISCSKCLKECSSTKIPHWNHVLYSWLQMQCHCQHTILILIWSFTVIFDLIFNAVFLMPFIAWLLILDDVTTNILTGVIALLGIRYDMQ